MKRKKWSELEEQTLLSKYSDLLNSGTLSKLKTREKKFKPIAEHVNSVHHLQDPITFPFKWSWRDVSIKVQNMRHQYLGVKQKIRTSTNDFIWADGEIHWENFLKYKDVFGDIELSDCSNSKFGGEDWGMMGLGYEMDSEEEDEEEEGDGEGGSDGVGAKEGNEKLDFDGAETKSKKGFKGKRLRMLGAKVLELRDVIVRREENKREREWSKEMKNEKRLKERENDIYGDKEMEFEEMQVKWAKREFERRVRLERELDEERRRRMTLEEKWEIDEMEWRERIVEMQIEHEKQMMQMHAHACQNQLNVLGVVARLVCQFFGAGSDGLGTIVPQVLQNLQHGDGGKNEETLPSEFL